MGRQVFTAGEILTAANMNDLGDQTVMVFDDATARATAIPTPVEGMVTYLKDTDRVDKFDGTDFVNVDTGGLVAVKSAIFTGTQTASVTASDNITVTGLSITHEVSNPANKLIISAVIGVAGNSTGQANVGVGVHDGSGLIGVGDAAGSRTVVSSGGFTGSGGTTSTITMPSTTFVHTPGAGSKTYTLRAINTRSDTRTLFINRAQDDSDAAERSRGITSLVIQEVSV